MFALHQFEEFQLTVRCQSVGGQDPAFSQKVLHQLGMSQITQVVFLSEEQYSFGSFTKLDSLPIQVILLEEFDFESEARELEESRAGG